MTWAVLLRRVGWKEMDFRKMNLKEDMAPKDINIIPYPEIIKLSAGKLVLGNSPRICTTTSELHPLACILSEEIRLLTNKKIAVTDDTPRPGDILLKIDPGLKAESYSFKVNDIISVYGGNYVGVAFGTVTLLQAFTIKDSEIRLPHLEVKDKPFVNYNGLMLDLARNWHPLAVIKQAVILCRWYKIRYLHLHFCDNESFRFPSKAFPELLTKGNHYTLSQLRELENFARDRGVTIIPEMDVPGHSRSAVTSMPELLDCDPPSGEVLCVGRESTYQTLDVLIGEFCEVFRSTPYFHIGADEVKKESWAKCKYCQAYMAENAIKNIDELYRHFIVRMNKVVKKHGKKMFIWEGFSRKGKIEIPRDITVMVFECLYNLPQYLIEDGYNVINTTWEPLYVVEDEREKIWSLEYIYNWNLYRWKNWWEKSKAFHGINIKPTKKVIGAQMCAWEVFGKNVFRLCRKRLPAMSERIWNPEANRSFIDFSKRLSVTDAKLTDLLSGKRI